MGATAKNEYSYSKKKIIFLSASILICLVVLYAIFNYIQKQTGQTDQQPGLTPTPTPLETPIITPTPTPIFTPTPLPTITPTPTPLETPILTPTPLLTPTPTPTPKPSLRSFAEKCGILIGTCVSYNNLVSDRTYREILAREFNVVTPENELKFGPVHPYPNTYNFRPADEIVKFAERNGMKVRGHCLVWHNQLPSWITSGTFTREELMDILKNHIYTVVGRYKGKIYAWDVVNEAIADDGSLRRTIWLEKIGPEYIELAFKWAHEADPDALLFYNDYGIEEVNRKSNAVYELVRELLRKGVPIHGVGFQSHLSLERPPNLESVARNIKRFEDLGLIVEITEMDVSIREPATSKELDIQAKIYGDILRIYLSSSNPKTFIMWGFVDKYSWISYTFPGYGSATIFDNNYQPKPAYNSLLSILEECSRSK